jgi:hypothetical protein
LHIQRQIKMRVLAVEMTQELLDPLAQSLIIAADLGGRILA